VNPVTSQLRSLLQNVALVIVLAGVFTWFGIYGVTGPLWLRYSMWLITIGTGTASSAFIIPFIFGTRFEPWPLPVRIAAGAALIAVPVTAALYAYSAVLGGAMSIEALPVQFLYVFAVCLVMVVGGYVLALASQKPAGSSDLTAPDATRAFLARLPLKFRQAELHAISSEDHYLRVHNNLGEELVLMRLADAIRALEGAGGLQVHRSWWVSKGAVQDVKREGGRVSLVLPSGKLAPVSRTFQADAKAAGLL
jgi:hypothetical protein